MCNIKLIVIVLVMLHRQNLLSSVITFCHDVHPYLLSLVVFLLNWHLTYRASSIKNSLWISIFEHPIQEWVILVNNELSGVHKSAWVPLDCAVSVRLDTQRQDLLVPMVSDIRQSLEVGMNHILDQSV